MGFSFYALPRKSGEKRGLKIVGNAQTERGEDHWLSQNITPENFLSA
jgi:hypothetical protein